MEQTFWPPFIASLSAAAVTTAGIVAIRRYEDWALRNASYFPCFAAGRLSLGVHPEHRADGDCVSCEKSPCLPLFVASLASALLSQGIHQNKRDMVKIAIGALVWICRSGDLKASTMKAPH